MDIKKESKSMYTLKKKNCRCDPKICKCDYWRVLRDGYVMAAVSSKDDGDLIVKALNYFKTKNYGV